MAKPIKKIRQAIILAGGMGLRLRPYTYDNPKAVVPVNGTPFLGYLINLLKANGIEEVVMLLGYMPEKIQEYLGDGSKFGIKVKYSIGTVDHPTGTRVRNAKDLADDTFILMYCDNYWRMQLNALQDAHTNSDDALVTMTVYTNHYGFTKNNVFINDRGYVTVYDKKRVTPGLHGVDVGFFIVDKKAFDYMPAEDFWLDLDFFQKLIDLGKLAGYRTDWPYYSLSTPERLQMTERLLGPQKVVFLDRDGVINKTMARGEYVRNVSEFKFLPGAKEGIKLLNDHGYQVYVISNQAGIGRGLMTDADLFEVHKYMEKELVKIGAHIDAIYYCPHKVEDNCLCRKPKAGMLYQAAMEHHIDLERATFIGDDPRDQEAGRTAGCKTILMKPNSDLAEVIKSNDLI
jgi:histidinol-phosphate phosphatase family protein